MVPKALLGGVIGFLIGGLVVSTAYTLNKDGAGDNKSTATTTHNQEVHDKLASLRGDDFDKAFIEEMIDHHQGAIDMAKLTETNAKHNEVKRLGQEIIAAQSKEIDMMQSWQGDWGYKMVPKSRPSH